LGGVHVSVWSAKRFGVFEAMSQPLPPIYCYCRRLLVASEAVVQRFSQRK